MKEVPVFSLGPPGTFQPLVPGDPTYYTERLSYEVSKFLYDLNQAGVKITQAEPTDLDPLQTEVTTFATELETWLSAATSEGTRGVPAVNRPSMGWLATAVSALVAAGGGVPALVVTVVVNIAIDLIVKFLEHLLIPETGDMEEVCDVLKQAFLDGNDSILKEGLINNGDTLVTVVKEALKDVDDETLVTILKKALLQDVEGELHSILERVADEAEVKINLDDKIKIYPLGMRVNFDGEAE